MKNFKYTVKSSKIHFKKLSKYIFKKDFFKKNNKQLKKGKWFERNTFQRWEYECEQMINFEKCDEINFEFLNHLMLSLKSGAERHQNDIWKKRKRIIEKRQKEWMNSHQIIETGSLYIFIKVST